MIRDFFLAVERWVFDEESMFIGFGKLMLVVCVSLAPIIVPVFYYAVRESDDAQARCLASGGGWAIVGEHTVNAIIPAGKVMVPTTRRVKDYGCVDVRR